MHAAQTHGILMKLGAELCMGLPYIGRKSIIKSIYTVLLRDKREDANMLYITQLTQINS